MTAPTLLEVKSRVTYDVVGVLEVTAERLDDIGVLEVTAE
jgi:hypothetical protein